MIAPYQHRWGFNVLQAAERPKQRQTPPVLLLLNGAGGTQPSSRSSVRTTDRLTFSTSKISAQSQVLLCEVSDRQTKQRSILSKDCSF